MSGKRCCPECGGAMFSVQYRGTPHDYDGTSEYRCMQRACDVRVGRWSGEVLSAQQLEPVYGLRTKPNGSLEIRYIPAQPLDNSDDEA